MTSFQGIETSDPVGQQDPQGPSTRPSNQNPSPSDSFDKLGAAGVHGYDRPLFDDSVLNKFEGWGDKGGPSEGMSVLGKTAVLLDQTTEAMAGGALSSIHNFAAGALNLFGAKIPHIDAQEALNRAATTLKNPIAAVQSRLGNPEAIKEITQAYEKQSASQQYLRSIGDDVGTPAAAMLRGSEMLGSLLGMVGGPEGKLAETIGARVSSSLAARIDRGLINTVEKAGLSLSRAEDAVNSGELLKTAMEQTGKSILKLSPTLSAKLTETAFRWAPEITGQAVGWGTASAIGADGKLIDRAKAGALGAVMALPMVITGRLGNYVENAILGKLGAPSAEKVLEVETWLNHNPSRGLFAKVAAGAVEGLAFPLLAADLEAYAPIVHSVLNKDWKGLESALITFGVAGPAGMALMRGIAPSQIPFYRARNRELEHQNFERALFEATGFGAKLREKNADVANMAEAKQLQGEAAAAEGDQVVAERSAEAGAAAKAKAEDQAITSQLVAEDRAKSFDLRSKEANALAETNVKAGAAPRSAVPPSILSLVDAGWSLTNKVSKHGESATVELELPGSPSKINLKLSQSDAGSFEIVVPHDLFAQAFPKSTLLESSPGKEPLRFQGEGAEAIAKALALRSNTDAAVMRMLAEKMGVEQNIAGIYQRADSSLTTLRFGKLYDSVDGGQSWFESDKQAALPSKKKPVKALADASDSLKRVLRSIEMSGSFQDGPEAAFVKRALESLDAAVGMIRNGSEKDPFIHETASLVSDPAFMAALSRMRDAGDMLDVAHEIMATAAGFSNADKSLERVLGIEKTGNERRVKQAEKRAQEQAKAAEKIPEEPAAPVENPAETAAEAKPAEAKPPAEPSKNTKAAIQALSKFEEDATWARKRKREGTLATSSESYEVARAAAAGEGVPSPLRILLEKPWSLRRGQPNPEIANMERLGALKRFAAAERVDQSPDKIELTNDRVANLLGVDRGTVAKYRKEAGKAYEEAVATLKKEATLARDREESPSSWFDALPQDQRDIVSRTLNERESKLDSQMMSEGGTELQTAWREMISALKAESKRIGSAAPAFAFFGEGHAAPTALGLGMAAMSYFGYRVIKNVELGKKVWAFTKLAYEKAIAPVLRNVGTIVREAPMSGVSKALGMIDRLFNTATTASLNAIGKAWSFALGKIRDLRNWLSVYGIENRSTPTGAVAYWGAGAMQYFDWSLRRPPTAINKLTRDLQAQRSEGEREAAMMSNKLYQALGEDPHVEGSKSYALVRAIQGKEEPPPELRELYEEAKAVFADMGAESVEAGIITPERIIKDYYPQGRGASEKDLVKAMRANPDIAAKIGFEASMRDDGDPFSANVMTKVSEQVVASGIRTGMANIGPFMPRSKGVLDPSEFKSDPRDMIPRNIIAERTVIAQRKMFNKIAADPALAVATEAEAKRLWGDSPFAYKQVTVDTNGQKMILGPLVGMFVHPSVHDKTKITRFWKNDFLEGMSILSGMLKRALVTANPTSFLRQEWGQTFVMSTIGVHGKWTHENKAWAENEIKTNGPMYRELSDAGQIGTEFAVEQIVSNRTTREDIYNLASGKDRGLFYQAIANIDNLFRSPDKLGAIAGGIENAYSKSDVLAKLIAYRELKAKFGKDEAIERVASLYNYQEMAPIMNSIGSFLWFQRFNYMTARSAIKYGAKAPFSTLAAPFLYAWGVRQLFSMLTGETEDDKRNASEIAGHGLATTAFEQFVLPLSRDKKTGRMNYLDLTTLNPMEGAARWTHLLESPYGSGTFSNPLWDVGMATIGAVRGVDPKLPGGKVFEESSSLPARVGLAAAYSLQQMAPAVSGVPMTLENVRSLGTSERDSARRVNKAIEKNLSPVPIVDPQDQAGIYASQSKAISQELLDLKAKRTDMIRDMRDRIDEVSDPKARASIFQETSASLRAAGFAPLSNDEAIAAVRYTQLKSPVARAVFSSGGAVQFSEIDDLLTRGKISASDAKEIFSVLKINPSAARQAIMDYATLNGIPVQDAASRVRDILARLRRASDGQG